MSDNFRDLVGSGVKRANSQRLYAIAEMPRPTTKRKVRRLLGALGYYREYIPQFARIAKSLTDLTHQCCPNTVQWDEEHERTFLSLQRSLCTPPVLTLPQIGSPFQMHTDASGSTVAASLGQLDKKRLERPIAFASLKLCGSPSGWAIIEKEAFAIIWALNRFRDIIYESRITVYCDHNPLQYIRECAPKSAKLLRWALDVDIKYTKGSQNVVADYLSRV